MMEHRCLSPWKGAVIGGLIVFGFAHAAWRFTGPSRVSRSPKDAESLARTIVASADGPGQYAAIAVDPDGTVAQIAIAYNRVVNRPIRTAIRLTLLRGFLVCAAAAFLWTWILGKIPGLTLKDAALYGFFFGLCAALFGPVQSLFAGKSAPLAAALSAFDAAAGWTLASMAISRCYAKACAAPAA